MWTKARLVSDAFGELALAGHVFDIEPEEQQAALRRLEALMGNWEGRGITLGYAFGGNPEGIDADVDSGLQADAVLPVVLHLAKSIAGGFGKQLSQQQSDDARAMFQVLTARAAFPPQQQLPGTLPRGAGNKPWRTSRPFVPQPNTSPLGINAGDDLTIARN